MRFLLDINTLIALAHSGHAHHRRVIAWYKSLMGTDSELLTTPITELGFVRVSVQAGLQPDIRNATDALIDLKDSDALPFRFLDDPLGVVHMPSYVKTPGQLTDGHLLKLAQHHSAKLATLDKGIPGALLIP